MQKRIARYLKELKDAKRSLASAERKVLAAQLKLKKADKLKKYIDIKAYRGGL